MEPQECPVVVLGRPANGIEFVISHYCAGETGLTHGASDPENFPLRGTTVNEITDEDHFPLWVSENTIDFHIVESA
jgi:hypothetical protein